VPPLATSMGLPPFGLTSFTIHLDGVAALRADKLYNPSCSTVLTIPTSTVALYIHVITGPECFFRQTVHLQETFLLISCNVVLCISAVTFHAIPNRKTGMKHPTRKRPSDLTWQSMGKKTLAAVCPQTIFYLITPCRLQYVKKKLGTT